VRQLRAAYGFAKYEPKRFNISLKHVKGLTFKCCLNT
jgi:hypothetical protein